MSDDKKQDKPDADKQTPDRPNGDSADPVSTPVGEDQSAETSAEAGATGSESADGGGGDTAATAKTGPPQPPSRPDPGRRSVAGALALVGVLLVVILGGGGGWYLHQEVQALHEASDQLARQSALESLESRQSEQFGELSGRLSQFGDTLEDRLQAMARLENRLEDQADARDTLADRIDQIYQRMESDADDWRQAEAAYLASIAVNRVRFHGDVGGALRALEGADDLLAALGGAGIRGREALAAATNRLLDAQRDDMPAIMTGLTRVADGLDDLPLAEGIERRAVTVPERPADDAPNGWQERLERAWGQFRMGLEGLVTVSRDRQVEPLPDPEARFLLQQNLILQLESARLAALRGESESYRQALARVDTWIDAYFDSAADSVAELRGRIEELAGLRVETDRPDIADDLGPVLDGGQLR